MRPSPLSRRVARSLVQLGIVFQATLHTVRKEWRFLPHSIGVDEVGVGKGAAWMMDIPIPEIPLQRLVLPPGAGRPRCSRPSLGSGTLCPPGGRTARGRSTPHGSGPSGCISDQPGSNFGRLGTRPAVYSSPSAVWTIGSGVLQIWVGERISTWPPLGNPIT